MLNPKKEKEKYLLPFIVYEYHLMESLSLAIIKMKVPIAKKFMNTT
jgi:hypothetical protein